MIFEHAPPRLAIGAIAAHSVRAGALVIKKGEAITPAHAEALAGAGVASVLVARLSPQDAPENEAAFALAQALAGANVRVAEPFNGRCNLYAAALGVLRIDARTIDRVNAVDEAIACATLPPFRVTERDEMVGTVKVIPFAVAREALAKAEAAATGGGLFVHPFQPWRIGVISTLLPGLKPSVVAKTLRVFEERLARLQAKLAFHERAPHEEAPLSAAFSRLRGEADLIVVFGASAITDRRDTVPSALLRAGGAVSHLGMPVDPGNLLMLGALDGAVVIGAPGCARSPAENGFDFVLQRTLAGLPVGPREIRAMGVGGLLKEIRSRPQPRAREGR